MWSGYRADRILLRALALHAGFLRGGYTKTCRQSTRDRTSGGICAGERLLVLRDSDGPDSRCDHDPSLAYARSYFSRRTCRVLHSPGRAAQEICDAHAVAWDCDLQRDGTGEDPDHLCQSKRALFRSHPQQRRRTRLGRHGSGGRYSRGIGLHSNVNLRPN